MTRIRKFASKAKFCFNNIGNLFDVLKILNSLLYHLYFYRITKRQLKGLHLGSGNVRIKKFLNIDASLFFASNITAKIERLKLDDGSVENIYNAHVFEHIRREDTQAVLKEWYRVLKPGGWLYICVPNLEELFNIYLAHLPAYESNKKSQDIVDFVGRVIYGGQDHKYNFHYCGFSFSSLRKALGNAGYEEIQLFSETMFNLKDGSSASVDGKLISLNLKAKKC